MLADETTFLVSVADSGSGLDAATAREAFRRGWTTKGDGRGLGLAMVGRSVRRLGGTIDVGGGPGAVFTVRLPLREEGI